MTTAADTMNSRLFAITHHTECRQLFAIPLVPALIAAADHLGLGTSGKGRLALRTAVASLVALPLAFRWISRGPAPPKYLRGVVGQKSIKTTLEASRALPGFGKVAVITGANTGMGYENTKQLAALGYHVIMVCREAAKAEAARASIRAWYPYARLDVVLCELTALAALRGDAARIIEVARVAKAAMVEGEVEAAAQQPIDVLICNAGGFFPGRTLTKEGFNFMLQANFLGPYILNRHLLPAINDKTGRVVTLGSIMHVMTVYYPPKSFECQTSQFEPVRELIDRCAVDTKGVIPELLRACEVSFVRKYVHSTYGLSKLLMVLEAKRLQKHFDEVAAAKQYKAENGEGAMALSVHPGGVATTLWRFFKQPFKSFAYKALMPIFFKTSEGGSLTALYCATAPRAELKAGGYYADCARAKENEIIFKPSEVEAVWTWINAATAGY